MDDFFNENEIITYQSIDELSDKIIYYKNNENQRIKIAKNGKQKYFKLFNERVISKHLVDISTGKKSSFLIGY